VKSLPRIAEKLIANGKDPATPAATIQWGTTTRQRTCVATVATIAEAVKQAHITAPAITIVGKVVTMRDKLNWFESRPLFGQTVVVTRTRDQASELSRQLEALGANVIEAPTIELTPTSDFAAVDAALQSLANAPGNEKGAWVVFTSANGVRATRQRMATLKLDARVFRDVKIAAIGNATARAIRDLLCLEPDAVPTRAVAEALADELVTRDEVRGRRFVLFRAEIGRQVLVERLRAGGADVEDVAIYQTRIASSLPLELHEAMAGNHVNWITFTSSSTVQNFLSLLGPDAAERLKGIKLASIGPVTTQTIRDAGFEPTVISESADVTALARAIAGTK